MKHIWEYSAAYDILRSYVSLCYRSSFRRYEVVGRENVPTDGAVIFASNHCCALMDALAILSASKKPVCFGTRADLFRKPRTAAVLRWLRMVPLARHERDSMESVAHNRQVFEEVAETVKRIPFALFVEGTHRPKRSLMPLRKGVFWIAQHALDHGCEKVTIVPTGLEYGDYFDYMTSLRVTFGEPIEYRGKEDKNILASTLYEKISRLITFFPNDDKLDEAMCKYDSQRRKPLKWWMIPLAVILLPFFLVCGALCLPVIVGSEIMVNRLEDKAWSNTIRFCFRLPIIVIWPFHSLFYRILAFYKSLIH